MFDGWTKPKFYTKCKTALRHLRTRLELIKKKRLAVEKFLKMDIADLLRGGLDYNAYVKADMLLIEQNVTACYELVEQFCGCISDHLTDMVKERECPEECREAAASLIFAAARFADLPELRQLRTLFTDKYGNSLESFASKEFAEKFKANPPSKDMKLWLMQDIAQEISMDWDSKALEQKLFTPPPPQQDQPKHSSLDEALPKRDKPARNEDLTHDSVKNQDNQQIDSIVAEDEAESNRPFYYRFIRPPYTRPRAANIESDVEESTKSGDNVDAKEKSPSDEPKQKPKAKSVRRRRSFRPDNIGNADTNQGDEDERVLDRLLRRLCAKKSQNEEGKAKGVAAFEENGETWRRHRATKSMSVSEAESSAGNERKSHGRASSVDLGGHVHPNLPEYDELAARIAALRGI